MLFGFSPEVINQIISSWGVFYPRPLTATIQRDKRSICAGKSRVINSHIHSIKENMRFLCNCKTATKYKEGTEEISHYLTTDN
jgi:hypothetical protein